MHFLISYCYIVYLAFIAEYIKKKKKKKKKKSRRVPTIVHRLPVNRPPPRARVRKCGNPCSQQYHPKLLTQLQRALTTAIISFYSFEAGSALMKIQSHQNKCSCQFIRIHESTRVGYCFRRGRCDFNKGPRPLRLARTVSARVYTSRLCS